MSDFITLTVAFYTATVASMFTFMLYNAYMDKKLRETRQARIDKLIEEIGIREDLKVKPLKKTARKAKGN